MNVAKRLYEYKDLFLISIWREFTIRYRQSVIGVLWAILQPLSMMLLFTFIFTYVMLVKVADYPYAIFFYSGILPWSFFSSALNYSIPSLTNYYNLITKIYFPQEIIPLTGIAAAFIDFLIASSFYILLLIYFGTGLMLNVLWVFPLLLLLFMLTIFIKPQCLLQGCETRNCLLAPVMVFRNAYLLFYRQGAGIIQMKRKMSYLRVLEMKINI